MEKVMEMLVTVLISAVCIFVLPFLKEKLGAEKLKMLWKWVCIAVQAAEQLFGSGKGEEKKSYVLETLKEKGITESPALDALIEAAVKELT